MIREFNESKEVCFECKHTKRFHNSVHKEGSCSQPTCSCCCFIESGVYYGMELFEAYEKGIEECLQALRSVNYDINYSVEEIKDILTKSTVLTGNLKNENR